jgi:hypothetical protein
MTALFVLKVRSLSLLQSSCIAHVVISKAFNTSSLILVGIAKIEGFDIPLRYCSSCNSSI